MHCWGSKLSFPPLESGQFMAIISAVGSGLPKWRGCSRRGPLRVRRMPLCLPGYYGEMCSSAVPLVPVRGAGVGYEGSRPTCCLAFAPFWRAAMASFREDSCWERGEGRLAVCHEIGSQTHMSPTSV